MGREAVNQITLLLAESDGSAGAALMQLVILIVLAVGGVALFRSIKRRGKTDVKEDEGSQPPTP